MKPIIFVNLFCVFVLGSCATLFNRTYKTVTISSNVPTKIIYQKDTFLVQDEIKIQCPRSKNPLSFTTLNDTLSKKYHVSSKLSSTIYLNLIGTGIPGIIIDAFSQKKYSYPHYINISPNDTINDYSTHRTTHHGDVFFNLNFPLLNWMGHQTATNASVNTFNISGFGVGVDYYYTNKNFINVSVNSINDLFTLVENATSNKMNYFTINRENYVSITHNHQLKKYFLGYGITVGRNIHDPAEYDKLFFSSPSIIQKNDVNYAAGLIVNSYIQAGKYLNIGIIYRPSFYTLNNLQPIQYQYYFGLDMRYRFRLKKGLNTSQSKFRDNFKHILFPE